MRLLITGHLGYVGRPLCAEMLAAGHDVVGCDIDLFAGQDWFAADLAVASWTTDVRDLQVADLRGFDAVIHLAGLCNDPLGALDREATFAVNTVASARLAARARSAGVRRFVAVSTCSIYGAAGDRWIDEFSAPNPVTAYAESKWQMEQAVVPLADDRFELVIARPGTVFGVSPRMRFDLVLNHLITVAMQTGVARLLSDGEAWRPLLHVRDLAAALRFLAEAPAHAVSGRAFNVGFNDLNLQIKDLVPILRATLPEIRVEFDPSAAHDPRSYRVDCSRLAALWQPAQAPRSIEHGVRELAAALSDHAPPEGSVESLRRQRADHLLRLRAQGRVDAEWRWRSAEAMARRD